MAHSFRTAIGRGAASRSMASITPQRRPRSRTLAGASQPTEQISSSPPRVSLLSAVANLCEIEGLTSKFESFAGRSAMLGVSIALVVEVLTEESLLAVSSTDAQSYAMLAALSIVAASAVAAVQAATKSSRQESPALLEPVITSLTAVQRSASSVTVDGTESLDQTVDNVLNAMFMRARLDLVTDESFFVDLE